MGWFNMILACAIFYAFLLELDAQACGINEEPANCFPCDRNCNNVTRICPRLCTLNRTFCHCKQGFVRGPNNACILQSQCNQTCGLNEKEVICQPCDGTCNNTNPICNTPICFGNQTFCACKQGYVRDATRNCIPTSQCNRTCDTVKCSQGKVCKLIRPFCPVLVKPCLPFPTCVPENNTTVKPCNILCIDGDKCINGRCVPVLGPGQIIP
uniref:TIL domain-containing protein n=1 Tax=Acrobeloides nanus TaxID=290746 RepID=A0A914E8E7_9BILA